MSSVSSQSFLFVVALCLHCCTQAFSSCGERGLLANSPCGGFSGCGAQALGTRALVVAALGSSSCGPWALGCADFSSCGAWA